MGANVLYSRFFTHPVIRNLIKKVRIFLVAPTTVYDHSLHGTGRFDDVSGFSFDASQVGPEIYKDAFKVPQDQLEESGMLIIIDDSDFSEMASIEQQLETLHGNQWEVILIKLSDEVSQGDSAACTSNQLLTRVHIRRSGLDEYFESLRMAQTTITQYAHVGASYVLH